MENRKIIFLLLIFLTIFFGCGGGGGGDEITNNSDDTSGTAIVLAANDLGMHCMDKEYSIFSILPPFNVVNAQILKQDNNGLPYLTDDVDVNVFYDSVADFSGSINSYSISKTGFWQYANNLFGISLDDGEGLTGLYMPDDDPQKRGVQPMEFNLQKEWFSAEGIPITPVDDALQTNPYPLLRISARDPQSNETLGDIDVVVPVATETDCQNCHKTGGIASQGFGWSNDPDIEVQSKINILILHDQDIAANTNLINEQPVLCARCHYSPALDLAATGPAGEQVGIQNLSTVMHKYHGELNNGQLFPDTASVDDTCYQCHPGNITQCQRGAMKTGGMDCNDCHGKMLAVGSNRDPWVDLPLCQSCHTGDAVNYLTGVNLVADPDWPFRLRQAYQTGDAAASPLVASNTRFVENTNTLFRFSKGHGGVFCEGCHGSTHAIWPNATVSANDNLIAETLQGYSGTIIECDTCHKLGSLPLTTAGPHGLHNINDSRWYDDGHEDYYENNANNCKACHGQNLTGTPLSKMPIARNLVTEDSMVSYLKGDLVRCDHCHEMP